ncbi:MAG: SDR family oxidoreductase [Chloroflexales bacterium]|nr:SDR family oxidoreductase [Chloroflexales bacterium]
MEDFRGKTALVTGASSGIGEAFARQLAAQGADVVLVARSEARLEALASELTARHGVSATVIAADLSAEGAAARLYDTIRVRGLALDVLINNAGFGSYGAFEQLDAAREHDEIMLNVTALVDLTRAAIPELLARKGAVINVASIAAFQPIPYMAVYGATKAFVLSFSEALWAQYRTSGLRVLVLCPGATATAFFESVGALEETVGRMDTPERVVAVALRALERRRSYVIPGLANALLAGLLPRLVPRSIVARVVERMVRPHQRAVQQPQAKAH